MLYCPYLISICIATLSAASASLLHFPFYYVTERSEYTHVLSITTRNLLDSWLTITSNARARLERRRMTTQVFWGLEDLIKDPIS